MMPAESLRGFVNAWETDENAHLNVQFYFRFFEDAAEHFLTMAGLGPADRCMAASRHVRFHSEMHNGELIRIETHAARAGQSGHWHLVHRMKEAATDRPAATALDTCDGGGQEAALGLASGEIPEDAAPRSLTRGPVKAVDADAGFRVSHRGRLLPDEVLADGHPRHKAIVARFSDAASHFWESIGVAQPWLAEHDYGRVAVEMKVSRGTPAGAGLVHLLTAPIALGGKTVSFRHLMVASDTGEVAAVGDVTALMFDRKARRSIALPEAVRAEVEARLNGA